MNRPAACLFDLDGLLLDTEPLHARAWQEAASRFGRPLSPEELSSLRGRRRLDCAEQVCAWIIKGHAPGEADKVVPGWGPIPDSGAVHRKVRVTVSERPWNVEATVEHDFALLLPIVGPMIGWLVNPWRQGQEWIEQRADETGNAGSPDILFLPHIRFRERAVLPKPYVTVLPSGLPGGW